MIKFTVISLIFHKIFQIVVAIIGVMLASGVLRRYFKMPNSKKLNRINSSSK